MPLTVHLEAAFWCLEDLFYPIRKTLGDFFMSEIKLKKARYFYTVTAVVFGADETLLNIELANDFKFVKRSLMPFDHLDDVFETDSMGLRRDYEASVVDKEHLGVICVEKKLSFEIDARDVNTIFNQNTVNDFASIDDQIRTIRFLNEGALRLKKIAFKMSSEKATNHGVNMSSHYNAIVPISESYSSKPIALLHLDDDAVLKTNFQIKNNLIPLSDTSLNICHAYYDLSYFNETYVSIVLLITALEMIFLKGEQGKKEVLSKRSAVYLYDDEEQVLSHYEKIKQIYKKRSDFVHDGKYQDIARDDIVFLRQCLRTTILKLLDDKRNKTQRITELKAQVQKVWQKQAD